MKKYLREHKWLLIIAFGALIIRIAFFLNVKPWEEKSLKEILRGDANEYRLLAEKTIEDGKYPENFNLDTFRTPVFPFFIIIFYFVFGIKPYVIFIATILLNIVSIFYIYYLCQKIFENIKVSIFASVLFALEPNVIKSVTEYLPDTLYSTLFLISVYYFISAMKDKRYSLLIIASIMFGISTLTRPVSLYFYFLCVIFIFLYQGNRLFDKLKYSLIFVSIYFLTLAPLMYRNYKLYGYFSTNSYQGNAALYYAGIAKASVENISIDDAFVENENSLIKICKENRITNPFDVDKQKQKMGFDYILNHIDVYIPLHLNGMLKFFIAPANNNKYSVISRVAVGLYFILIYSLALIGFYRMIKNGKYLYAISLITIVFYFSFLTGVVGLARYRLPSTTFYLILCAFGIYYIYDKYKNNFKSSFLSHESKKIYE